jgi:hypothetical protein
MKFLLLSLPFMEEDTHDPSRTVVILGRKEGKRLCIFSTSSARECLKAEKFFNLLENSWSLLLFS